MAQIFVSYSKDDKECDVYHKNWDVDGYEDCEREIKSEIRPDGVNYIG